MSRLKAALAAVAVLCLTSCGESEPDPIVIPIPASILEQLVKPPKNIIFAQVDLLPIDDTCTAMYRVALTDESDRPTLNLGSAIAIEMSTTLQDGSPAVGTTTFWKSSTCLTDEIDPETGFEIGTGVPYRIFYMKHTEPEAITLTLSAGADSDITDAELDLTVSP